MPDRFLTFRRFDDPFEARDFILFLERENIPYQVEDASPAFDVSFAHNVFEKQVHVKLQASDFEFTEQLLMEEHAVDGLDIPDDYYLVSFSNKELSDILIKPDEWSAIDYNIAVHILRERGVVIERPFLQVLRNQRNQSLAEPERSDARLIVAGYILALLGGLLGIFIGWHLLTFKKTLPNGSRSYAYILSNRKKGRTILILSLISLLIWITLLIGTFKGML